MARPQQYRDADLCAALEAAHGMIYLAAARLGCDPATFYRRLKRSAALRAVRDQQRGRMTDVAEMKLYQAIQQGEAWAIQFYLRTQGRDRGYGDRIEHAGAEPLRVEIVRRVVREPADADPHA